MILSNLTICNFKNFFGIHNIDFPKSNNGKKNNIVLIGGLNGSGKSTILEAIKLCLYGKKFSPLLRSQEKFKQYLEKVKNRDSVKEGNEEFFIQLTLELEEIQGEEPLIVRREWKSSIEELTIKKGTNKSELIDREYWEDYLCSLVPPYITDYFFFDGEKIKELAVSKNSEYILGESIKTLIGLSKYNTLRTDLLTLSKSLTKKSIQDESIKQEYNKLDEKLKTVESECSRIYQEIDSLKNNKEQFAHKKSEIEDELRKKAGVYAKDRTNLESNLSQKSTKLENINEEIRVICGEVLPFLLAKNVFTKMLQQLRLERKQKINESNIQLLDRVKDKLAKRISGIASLKKLGNRELISVKNELLSVMDDIVDKGDTDLKFKVIHKLSDVETEYIESFFKKLERKGKAELKILLGNRSTTQFEIKDIKGKLSEVPDDEYIKDYVKKLSKMNFKLEQIEEKIENNLVTINELQEKKENCEQDLYKIEEKITQHEDADKKLSIIKNVNKSIEEYTDKLARDKINELSCLITKIFNAVSNKDDLIKEISIDSENFEASLYNENGDLINKDELSTGEREVYTLSVLWGLTQITDKKFPLIFDSPFSNLDSSHVTKLIDNFFPNAANQVILLSHDREIDKPVYEQLKPYLNKTYRLNYHAVDKLEEGYFYN